MTCVPLSFSPLLSALGPMGLRVMKRSTPGSHAGEAPPEDADRSQVWVGPLCAPGQLRKIPPYAQSLGFAFLISVSYK